jgi:hypothetical protein
VAVLVRLLVFAVRVLGLLFLARLLFGALGGRAPQASSRGPRAAEPPASPDLVRDRVCNTFIPRDRAVRAIVGHREEYFCSAACRDRALADAPRAS